MIIQAGFDLELLARPLIVREGKVLPKLVVIGMDAEMQVECLEVVPDQYAGKLEPHFDFILDNLDPEWTRYFAIAHGGIWPEGDYYSESPILQGAKTLKAAAAQRGFLMIGHFGLDETGYMCNGPHYYFDQYYLGLPKTMDHWVHSRFGKCS